MQDAAVVGVLDGVRQRLEQLRRAACRQRLSGQLGREIGSLHEIHGEILQPGMLADLVDGHDVRMLQLGGGHGLRAESLDHLGPREFSGRHQLDGHQAPQAELARPMDHPHAATRDFPLKLVVAEVPQDGGRWRFLIRRHLHLGAVGRGGRAVPGRQRIGKQAAGTQVSESRGTESGATTPTVGAGRRRRGGVHESDDGQCLLCAFRARVTGNIEDRRWEIGEGQVPNRPRRCLISASTSASFSTVSATSAWSCSRKRWRSRCTATFTAPSFMPSRSPMSA